MRDSGTGMGSDVEAELSHREFLCDVGRRGSDTGFH